MLNLFKKQMPEPVMIDPMDRLKAACDEMNEALKALPEEHRSIRPYVQSGSYVTGRRAQISLGHWYRNGEPKFVITYGPKEI